MIDEPLTDADRRFLLGLLHREVPAAGPPSEQVLRLLRQLSGSDTVVVCHRAYPSAHSRKATAHVRELAALQGEEDARS
jgi:hypothetical protein